MTTDKEELRKEGWEKHWEIVNNQIKEGVNPYAYRLGFLDCSKQLEAKDREIAELDEQLQLQHDYITDLRAEIERLKAALTESRKYVVMYSFPETWDYQLKRKKELLNQIDSLCH